MKFVDDDDDDDIDQLLLRLARAGIGCHIDNFYVGTLAYADDVVLIAPNASAMRKMLAICEFCH